MKTAIVYESTHHGNTRKLVEAIVQNYDIDTIDVTKTKQADLSGYDCIAFASGIAFGNFYPEIQAFAQSCLPEGKRVILLYTCGKDNPKYSKSMEELAKGKGCKVLGCFRCKGYDTYGPFKLLGGINKGHPDQAEIAGAIEFWAASVKFEGETEQ